MEKCLEGKVAIVTGSGQGIGKGIARGLARLGAKVITNNRRPNGESAQKYHKEEQQSRQQQIRSLQRAARRFRSSVTARTGRQRSGWSKLLLIRGAELTSS